MFTIILLMYLQSNLDVMLVKTSATGEFRTKAACETAAGRKRTPLPVPEGYAAAWQDAACVPINRGVTVVTDPESELINLPRAAAPPAGDAQAAEPEKPAKPRKSHARAPAPEK